MKLFFSKAQLPRAQNELLWRLQARRVLAAVILIPTLALSGSLLVPRARALLIERVVAVVNDRAILLSDVRRRAVPMIPQAMRAESEKARMAQITTLYKDILNRLVDEYLIQESARQMNVQVTARDIDRAIQNVQAQSGLTGRAFWDAVSAQGLSYSEYRDDIRRQILRLQVLNKRIRGRVQINEREIRQRYEDSVRQARRAIRYQVAHVFLPVSGDAPADQVAAVKREIDTIEKTLTAANFMSIAEQRGGGDLGWLKQGDLPPVLEQAVMALSAGKISEPVRGPSGFHIFLLREQQRGLQNIPPYNQVKDTIYRSLVEQAMSREEQIFLRELRRKAVIDLRL